MPTVTKIREDQTALKKERMLIGGKWVDSASGEWLEVEDPGRARFLASEGGFSPELRMRSKRGSRNLPARSH